MLLQIFLVTTLVAYGFACPTGTFPYKTACYWVINQNTDYAGAENACQQSKGRLAIIRERGVEQFLENTVRESRIHGSSWVGMSDREREGDWLYSDGQAVKQTEIMELWLKGEPNGGREENCGVMFGSEWQHKIGDESCYNRHPAICETKAQEKPKIDPKPVEKDKHVKDCAAIKKAKPDSTDGIYKIMPDKTSQTVEVWCDMTRDGGGWTVFQKRGNYEFQENFFRGTDDYRKGFGNKKESYWLGLDTISQMTKDESQILRVDLQDFNGTWVYALYYKFRVGSALESFKLKVGHYVGDAGDSMAIHNNRVFTTKENDIPPKNCAKNHKGGWWYAACHEANLNGQYLKADFKTDADGVVWKGFRGWWYSLKVSEMKMRPMCFN